MELIVDTSFFYGDLSIAQISTPAIASTVTNYIKQYEPRLLIDLLGFELYKLYDEGVTNDTQKYLDIKDGKEYTNRAGRPASWRGFKEIIKAPVVAVVADPDADPPVEAVAAEAGIYSSLIANYIYCKWVKDQATASTGTGEKTAKAENAEDASPRYKIARAWNQMVDWNCELVEFLLTHETDYPEFLYHYSNRKLQNLITSMNPLF